MKIQTAVVAFICSIAINCSYAQTATPDTGTHSFMMNASIGGMQEITSANVALKKAKNTELKSFAAMMIKDHTRIGTQLMQIIKTEGYSLPPQATEKVLPNAVLTENSGVDFDRVYTDLMIADHQATVSLFENYAAVGKDTQLKAFAQRTLPTLKEHLAAIKALSIKVKPSSL